MRKIITICIIGLFALNVQAQPVKTLKLYLLAELI